MTTLAVITPTWRPDADMFEDLHASVLAFTPEDTVHHVIVPWVHRKLFLKYTGERFRLWTHQDLIPRRYWRMPSGVWLNVGTPWPPVRGWIMQQAMKIALAGQVDTDVAVLVDSDVALVRPTCAETFAASGRALCYREENGVHDSMQRHVLWHQVARRLLGADGIATPPLPDYVSPVGIWDPAVVRAMQDRITEVSGRPWLDSFTRELHVSEFIVYGVFVDHVLSPIVRPPSTGSLCHNSWVRSPLDERSAMEFADQLPAEAVAVMISSHSRTPLGVRRAALRRCTRAQR